MPAQAGSMVELREVLLVDDAGEVQVGAPFVEGARVVAEVIDHGRDKKILVFKYKNKTRYRRRHGHRQAYTRLAIRQILTDGHETAEIEGKKPVRTSRKRTATKTEEQPSETQIEAAAPAVPMTEATTEPDEGTARPRRAPRARKAVEAAGAEPESSTGAQAKPARRARATKKSENGE